MLWKDPCFKIEVNDELPNPCSGPKWRYQWVIGHYNKGHKNGFRRRGQNWVKNQVAPRQILHQLFSGHCSLSTGGTAQISFYYVREFLLVDHSSSLNKVIHTESYCTDVLHLKWQSTGQYPEESDTLMNKYYVQPLIQHCLASFKNQPSWESPSGDELDLEFETKLVKIFHQDFFKTKHMSSSKLSICGNGFVKTFISSLCSYRCSGMFR